MAQRRCTVCCFPSEWGLFNGSWIHAEMKGSTRAINYSKWKLRSSNWSSKVFWFFCCLLVRILHWHHFCLVPVSFCWAARNNCLMEKEWKLCLASVTDGINLCLTTVCEVWINQLVLSYQRSCCLLWSRVNVLQLCR